MGSAADERGDETWAAASGVRSCWRRRRARSPAAGSAAAGVGANDDTGKYAPGRGRLVLRRHGGPRPAAGGDHRALAAERPARAHGSAAPRPHRRRGARARASTSSSRRTRIRPARSRRGLARPGGVRRVARRARARVPGGAAVRRRQRAEPAGVLASAVLDGRAQRSASGVRAVPRGGLRRARRRSTRTLTVVGVGLSPRGNDRPQAKSNVSTSPVRFLAALGALVPGERARAAADGRVQLPPVPEQRDRLARRAATRGRTPASSTSTGSSRRSGMRSRAPRSRRRVDGLRLYLDEVGWQVDTTGLEGYVGSENVPVTSELAQASVYGELVRRAACDPDVAAGQHLRLPRRRAPHRLPGGPPSRRRHAAPRGGRRSARRSRRSTCPSAPRQWRRARSVVGARAAARWRRRGPRSRSTSPRRRGRTSACASSTGRTRSRARKRLLAHAGACRPATCATGAVRPKRRATLRLARATGESGTRSPCGSPPRRTRAARRRSIRVARRATLTANMCSVTMRTDVRVVLILARMLLVAVARRRALGALRG